MSTKRNVLVVGGAGFIGSHLVDTLLHRGHHVEVIDNFSLGRRSWLPKEIKAHFVDASDKLELRDFFDWSSICFDLVYNLAVMPLPHSLQHPDVNISTNINIVENLCSSQHCGLFDNLIHFSSSEVYGTCIHAPMDEQHPTNPTTPYAASKAAGDLICLSYVKTFGSKISIIRPFNNYGPRQNDASYAGVIPATINKLMRGETPSVTGTGKQTRDYIYVTETAYAASLLGDRLIKDPAAVVGEVFNIASGHDIEILWLVKKISEIMGMMGHCVPYDHVSMDYIVMHEEERPADVLRHIANTLKAKDILGFNHHMSMEQGLKKTISWYLANRR